MLKILGRATSINVRKVLWLADEMGLSYEREDWGLPNRDPKVPEFRALNPNAQVPVLVNGDFVLWESSAIMTYLTEALGPTAFRPESVETRALSNQWLGWQGSDLAGVWGYAVMALVRKLPGYDDEAKISASLEQWTAKMDILEARLKFTGAFVAGTDIVPADIALGLAAHRWFSVERELKPLPYVRAYYDRLRARPGSCGPHDLGDPVVQT